MRFAEKMDESL